MAKITVLPDSESLGIVDVQQLMEDRGPLPPIDPQTRAPTGLRSLVVSEDPRMVAVPQFLSPEECQHLCDLAQGGWIRSLVGKYSDAKAETVESAAAQTRTSSSCPLRPAQTAIVQRIEHRLAQLAKLPIETLERLVVLRYEPGQEFTLHHDGKFRPITIFLYLNELPTDAEGGDTHFPHLGFSFVPRRGCAVMWPNAQADGAEDSRMVHAGRPPSTGVKYGVNCFFNLATKRLVRPGDLNMSSEECYMVNIASLEEGKKQSGEDRSCPRRRTFTLDTDPNVRVVPGFLTPDEAEYFASLASEDLGTSAGDLGFPGAAVLLQTQVEPVAPTARQIEERLTNWNEFAPENLGYLRLVRANTQIGMGNRGCGQRSATICLSEQADVHFPHIGVRIAMSRGDLLEWPNAWFQEEAASNPKEKVTVEDLRTTHVHLAPSLMLDASFHDKPVRTADGEKDSRPPK